MSTIYQNLSFDDNKFEVYLDLFLGGYDGNIPASMLQVSLFEKRFGMNEDKEEDEVAMPDFLDILKKGYQKPKREASPFIVRDSQPASYRMVARNGRELPEEVRRKMDGDLKI